MTKDPVCGMNVDENKCKEKFDQKPEQYARSAA
jgi:YHS domain-containing protein